MSAAPTPTDDELKVIYDSVYRVGAPNLRNGLRAVFAAGRIQALEEAAQEYASGKLTGVFYSRDDYTKAWLHARAAVIRIGEK